MLGNVIIERCLAPELNSSNPRREVIMRKFLKLILIIGVIGSLVYHLRTTEPSTRTQPDAQDRTDTLTRADKLAPPSLGAPLPQPNTPVDSEQAALVNVMKTAIAARHGGMLPNTLSDEDAKAASQAATKWQGRQAAEKTKRGPSNSGRHNKTVRTQGD